MSIVCVCTGVYARASMCVCVRYESVFISNTWFLLGAQLRAKTLHVGVCMY